MAYLSRYWATAKWEENKSRYPFGIIQLCGCGWGNQQYLERHAQNILNFYFFLGTHMAFFYFEKYDMKQMEKFPNWHEKNWVKNHALFGKLSIWSATYLHHFTYFELMLFSH